MGRSDVREQQPVAAAPDTPEHPLMSLVPVADRPLVRAKTDALCADDAPDLQSGRMYARRAVALTVAAMAPELSTGKLALLLRYCRWTIWLDAQLDDPDASPADVRRSARSVLSALDGDAAGEPELAAILAGLNSHDPAGRLVTAFSAALRDAVAAGLEHTELSERVAAGQAAPPAERYLDLSSRDVNYRSVALALVLLVGADPARTGADPADTAGADTADTAGADTADTAGADTADTADYSEIADELDEAIAHACRAVRLANDVRTADKDLRDDKLNILALRTHDGAPVTAQDVDRWIDHHVDTHSQLLVQASGKGLREQSRALANSLRMAVGLYRLQRSE